jgi:hypothetical protein
MKIRLSSGFQTLDLAIVRWMSRFGPVLLRVTLGIVFVWFGILKFFPNVSPAQELAAHDHRVNSRPGSRVACTAASRCMGMFGWAWLTARARSSRNPVVVVRADARHSDSTRPFSLRSLRCQPLRANA